MLTRFSKGDWIGAYQVESRLRAGGMATLFLARRSGAAGFSRVAAIKVIHPHLSEDERFVRMFVDEARISSKISHPNVVHVEEFGEESGLFFLVMEYVDGCSASQLLRMLQKADEKMVPEFAAHIAFKVAEGLHAAHETIGDDGELLNIVHRDVSPSNVLLSHDGSVKIIDFGIAKARGRVAGTEAGSALKGKIRYMSPEQARGKDVDRRSDVYAVGVVLWELLATQRAFDADNELALLDLVRDPKLRPIREVSPDVPEALAAVIATATSPNPDDRPSTAYELSRMIAKAMPGALLVDRDSFETLIGRVPRKMRSRDGATPASLSEHSWVTDISKVRSQSGPNLAYGSSQMARLAKEQTSSGRPPTVSEVFDPNLFVEPTPLPGSLSAPGYDGSSYDDVVIASVQPSSSNVAADPKPQPWLSTSRAIVIGAVLVSVGIMAGIFFGSGRSEQPPPQAAQPSSQPAAATPDGEAVRAADISDPVPANSTKPTSATLDANAGEPADNVASSGEGEGAAANNAEDAGKSTKKKKKTRYPKRGRSSSKSKSAASSKPSVEPAPRADRRVDGVTIASDPDDDNAKDKAKDKAKRVDTPRRAGKTPIADGFDD